MSCPLPMPLVSRPPLHRWKVLAAGVAANAAFSVAFSGLPMTAVLLRQAYQLDNALLGLMLGLMGLGIALSELPWGLLTDRLGDRPVLLTGLGSTALALLALALWAAPGAPLWVLGAGLLGVGLLGGSVNGASGRAVMGWFPAIERGLAMSIRQTAVPLGGGVGALLLPWLAWQGGFACLFGVLAGLCGAAALLCAAWVHEPAHSAHSAPAPAPGAGLAAPAPRALRDRRVWRLAAGIGLLCAPQFAVISFGTVFLHDFGGLSLPACTGAMALVQVGAMGLRVWSGRWTDRHGNRPAYLRACVGAVIAVFLGLAALSALQSALPSAGGGGQPKGSKRCWPHGWCWPAWWCRLGTAWPMPSWPPWPGRGNPARRWAWPTPGCLWCALSPPACCPVCCNGRAGLQCGWPPVPARPWPAPCCCGPGRASEIALRETREHFLELVLPLVALRLGDKAGLEAVARQRVGVVGVQPGGGKGLHEVVVQVAAKVGRVVRIDGGHQAGIEQLAQVRTGQVGEDAQRDVGEGAHGQRDAVLGQALHQGRVFEGLHAVVDALDLQHIEGAPDVGRRAFFAGVGHQTQAQLAAARKDAGKLFRRVAQLARIQAHADEVLTPGQGLLQGGQGIFLAEVAQKAQEQRGMHHVVGGGTLQVGPGHVVEILLFQQHAGAGVVDVEKALQIGEGIRPAQAVHIGVGQAHAIALGQGKDQLGLERALDVDVQLGLGHAAQQLGQAGWGDVGNLEHGGLPGSLKFFTTAPTARQSVFPPCRPGA